MTEATRADYEALLAHWDRAFSRSEAESSTSAQETAGDAWKRLAPSEKLFAAARSMKHSRSALDYGSGDGWAGIVMARCGCRRVTCADVAPNAREAAARNAERYGVRARVHPICIRENWLGDVPDGTFDGFFCSNVLDVVPPEMADMILYNAARALTGEGRAVVGLNYFMSPALAVERGLELREGNRIYIGGVLRLVSRTDGEWMQIIGRHFRIERLEHFAWPGEKTETRRLFYLRKRGGIDDAAH